MDTVLEEFVQASLLDMSYWQLVHCVFASMHLDINVGFHRAVFLYSYICTLEGIDLTRIS